MKRQNLWIGHERIEEKEKQVKGIENILNKIIHDNFPNLKKIKVPTKLHEACRTTNRTGAEKKFPMKYNNQNIKYPVQRHEY